MAILWKYAVNLARVAVRYAFALLDLLVPKDNHLVVFGSSGGQAWFGNSKALFEYVRENPRGLKAYYYLWRRPCEDPPDRSG